MAGNQSFEEKLALTAARIREMREITGFSVTEMAEKTDTTEKEYRNYEEGKTDFPFNFLHKCALAFGIDLLALLEGSTPKLRTYTVTRSGEGEKTVDENGIQISRLAPLFSKKLAEPYYVKYAYSAEQQNMPIRTNTHKGQEFDYVVSGSLKVQVGANTEILQAGDSILYNSSEPHGMIAVGGSDCVFLAVVLPGDDAPEEETLQTVVSARSNTPLLCEKFIHCTENSKGVLKDITFTNEDKYNFGFDTVDAIADRYPDKLALLHVDKHFNERRFTFADIKRESARTANYLRSLGIKKGDKVMLVLKRHYQFWFVMTALHKMGVIAIPASNQLVAHDFEYRFTSAGISAVICTSDNDIPAQVEMANEKAKTLTNMIVVGGSREGWHDYDAEYKSFSDYFPRSIDTPCGNDLSLMFFTSGTTGYPKIAAHSYLYALGHFITAKYWHCCERDGLHFTISDTGWGKALWGKYYGQWLCEGAVFVYDFDRFDANTIMPMFAKYGITTFCAPPTMLRLFIKEDLSKFDLSGIHHMTTAGEALNPEVFRQFEAATGLQIMEGFGQTETTLLIGNLAGSTPRLGSMGKPSPLYDVDLVDQDGNPVPLGETGEIVVHTDKATPCGLYSGYYRDEQKTKDAWHDGLYHTGDTAWKDEDGYYWYVGRTDDVIKSSGYRIGPFEIESVIMELPYVLECGVSAAPDEVRGQVVKASIVLVKGTEPTEELKKEIQNYVKAHTAPYKYPRIVVFRDELPKSTSGKIQRNKL